MFNIGGGELLLILLLALIVLGPQKLPEAARTVGRVVRELQRLSSGFQREFQKAIEDDELNNLNTGRTTTRPEAVPLASVIGDLDADESDDTSDDDAEPDRSTGEGAPAAITPTGADGNGNGAKGPGSNGADTNGHRGSVTGDDTVALGDDTVADEVGQALDEIVATSSPPSGPETDLAADTATDDAVSPAHDAPAQADDPDGGDR